MRRRFSTPLLLIESSSFIAIANRPSGNMFLLKLNLADSPSRGMIIESFLPSTFWKHGPEFLWLTPAQWPEQPLKSAESIDSDPEVKGNSQKVSFLPFTHEQHVLESLICRFSSWQKLLRVYAWVVRFKILFLKNLAKKRGCVADRKASFNHSGTFNVTEIS